MAWVQIATKGFRQLVEWEKPSDVDILVDPDKDCYQCAKCSLAAIPQLEIAPADVIMYSPLQFAEHLVQHVEAGHWMSQSVRTYVAERCAAWLSRKLWGR